MTSQALSVKGTAPFWRLYLMTLRQNLAVIILGTILSVLAFPVFAVTVTLRSLLMTHTTNYPLLTTQITGIGGLVFVRLISLVLIAVLSIMNLSFLHKKNSSDLFYSIPITRKALYLSRLAATFTGAVIPVLVSTLFGIILNALNPKISGTPTLSLVAAALVCIATTAVISITTGAFMLFTGHTFDAVASFLVINFGLPMLAGACYGYAESMLLGMSVGSNTPEVIFGASPLGGMAVWFIKTLANLKTPQGAFSAALWVGPIWILLAAAILVGSLIFSKRRRSEAAGEAFAHDVLPVLLQLLVSVLVAFLFGEMFSAFSSFSILYLIFAAVGALIAAVLVGAIVRRGFKRVVKDLAIGGVAVGLVLTLGLILLTGGLGFEARMPALSEIRSAHFTCTVDGDNMDELSSSEFTEPEDLERLLALHRAIIQNNRISWRDVLQGESPIFETYDEWEDETDDSDTSIYYDNDEYIDIYDDYYYAPDVNFRVVYILKNGTRIDRDYRVPAEELQKEITAVKNSKNYMNRYVLEPGHTTEHYSIQLSAYWVDDEEASANLTLAEVQEIIDAYANDIRNGKGKASDYLALHLGDIRVTDPDSLMDSTLFNWFYYDTDSLCIPVNFTETIAKLKDCGLDADQLILQLDGTEHADPH